VREIVGMLFTSLAIVESESGRIESVVERFWFESCSYKCCEIRERRKVALFMGRSWCLIKNVTDVF